MPIPLSPTYYLALPPTADRLLLLIVLVLLLIRLQLLQYDLPAYLLLYFLLSSYSYLLPLPTTSQHYIVLHRTTKSLQVTNLEIQRSEDGKRWKRRGDDEKRGQKRGQREKEKTAHICSRLKVSQHDTLSDVQPSP